MRRAALQFQVHPSSGLPLYRQIVDQVYALRCGGRLQRGELLPSVRQVAADLQINPMTVSRAYNRLEAEGVLERVRGRGMRLRPPAAADPLPQRRRELAEVLQPALTRGRQLGLTDQQILSVARSVLREAPTCAGT